LEETIAGRRRQNPVESPGKAVGPAGEVVLPAVADGGDEGDAALVLEDRGRRIDEFEKNGMLGLTSRILAKVLGKANPEVKSLAGRTLGICSRGGERREGMEYHSRLRPATVIRVWPLA
jgi:hypothetical protein